MRFRIICFLFVASAGAVSCSSRVMEPVSNFERDLFHEESSRLFSNEAEVPAQSQAHYDFLRGQLALANENYGQALDYFQEAAKLDDSASPTLHRSLAQLYVRTGKIDDALREVEEALKGDSSDTDLLQFQAGILSTKREFAKAIEVYKRIIAVGKEVDEDPYVLAASLYAQQGNLESAKSILRQLINKKSDSFFGHYYLGRMAEAANDFMLAEQSYRQAMVINPQANAVPLDLARLYGSKKRYKEAIEICQKLLAEDPSNTAARNMLAQLLIGDNDIDKALKEFETLGALEEDPTDTRLKIALIKLQRRDLEGAVTDLNLILSQHPDNMTAQYYLVSAYAGLKRVQDALLQIQKIEKTSEYFVESRVLGAFLLQQEKRYKEAIALLDEALGERVDDLRLLSLRSSLERESGDVTAAIRSQQRIVQREPKSAKHFFTLGVLYDEARDKEAAVGAMRSAIELDPRHANALNYLGYTLLERKEKLDEAESLIKRALEVEKDNGYFIDSLGWLYYQRGQFKEAVRELERAVQLVPNDSVILEHYALALQKVGDRKKAREIAEKAMTHSPDSDDKEVAARLEKLLNELKSR